jgi:hypothetical protein
MKKTDDSTLPILHFPNDLTPGDVVKLWRSSDATEEGPIEPSVFEAMLRTMGRNLSEFVGYFLVIEADYCDALDYQKAREPIVYEQCAGSNLTLRILDPGTMKLDMRYSPYYFVRRIDQDDP